LTEILKFYRLKDLNADPITIFEALKNSFVVEIKPDFMFIRKRPKVLSNGLELLGFSKQGI